MVHSCSSRLVLCLTAVGCILASSCTTGFVVTPTSVVAASRPTTTTTTSTTKASSSLHDLPLPADLFSSPSSIMTASEETGLAFTDSVSLTDGPIGLLLVACGIFAVAAFALITLSSQMDVAIDKVLVEFECTLKRFYAKRWKEIEETELQGLEGDARDIKLLKVMEQLQQDEPEFMTQVASKQK